MKRKYLLLPLAALILVLSGCKTITQSDPLAPLAPSNLTATAIAYDQIDLTWRDNSDDEEGFYVYAKTTGSYYEITDLPANTTYFAHSGLEPLEKYTYYVQVYNEFGAADSSIAEATTLSGVDIVSYYWKRRYGCIDVTGQARNTTNETLAKVSFIHYFYDADAILVDSMNSENWNIPPLATFNLSTIVYRGNEVARVSYVTGIVTGVDID